MVNEKKADDPFRCAGCGQAFILERAQCGCLTGIGVRCSDGLQVVCEQNRVVTIPYDEYQMLRNRPLSATVCGWCGVALNDCESWKVGQVYGEMCAPTSDEAAVEAAAIALRLALTPAPFFHDIEGWKHAFSAAITAYKLARPVEGLVAAFVRLRDAADEVAKFTPNTHALDDPLDEADRVLANWTAGGGDD